MSVITMALPGCHVRISGCLRTSPASFEPSPARPSKLKKQLLSPGVLCKCQSQYVLCAEDCVHLRTYFRRKAGTRCLHETFRKGCAATCLVFDAVAVCLANSCTSRHYLLRDLATMRPCDRLKLPRIFTENMHACINNCSTCSLVVSMIMRACP